MDTLNHQIVCDLYFIQAMYTVLITYLIEYSNLETNFSRTNEHMFFKSIHISIDSLSLPF